MDSNGVPVVQVGLFRRVPVTPLPLLSIADSPTPSSRPQRPIRPGAVGRGPVIVDWISAALRATFQIRGSSRAPRNAPLPLPAEFTVEASAACWMLSKRGVKLPTTS